MNTRTLKHSTLKLIVALSAAILCGAARAEEPVGDSGEKGELEAEETSFVSGEFSLRFDSKYISYGFVDNKDPIMTPDASLTFGDLFTIGAYAMFDVTRYGRRAGYTSRQWQCTELHPYAEVRHVFSSEDCEWLPTSIEIAINYDYEHMANALGRYDRAWSKDTQFWTIEIGLPDLWLEPNFTYEQDTMRDHGIYMNLEIGHTFALVGDEEDPTVTLRPSIAQGYGNRQRVAAYAGYYAALGPSETGTEDEEEVVAEELSHAGLMDTVLKLELTWNITEWLSVSCYGAYSDFLFDRKIREASRDYESLGKWDESWNFYGGFALTASF